MLQLKVYESTAKEEQFFLDLYETEPIKLTISIEDITNADATSVYSKAFKVPGTRKNAEFFKNVFDVDATLYDVTLKKPAEILVDGAEFKTGHVRLQKIFWNGDLDRYDYELIFLGETRDFSSAISDKTLCQLQIPDIIGGVSEAFSPDDAVLSWQAYPENPSLTAGLHNGNILYPLIDHGNTYDEAGLEQQTRISTTTGHHSGSFTQNGHPLTYDRLKPMVRAKRIWDQIFEDTGYTYTSEFIESELFHQIYISAFGNTATINWDTLESSSNSNNIASGTANDDEIFAQVYNINIVDPGSNLAIEQVTIPNNTTATTYTIPVPGEYTFEASATANIYREDSDYSFNEVPAGLIIYNATQNVALATGFYSFGFISVNATLNTTTTSNFTVGDKIVFIIDPVGGMDRYTVTNSQFAVTSAPGDFNPITNFDCSYKQIDFIKDILLAFRLILSPDPKDPNNFIIEPWQTYINSGNLYDWSDKLIQDKDVITEPVFFSQSNEIKFRFQEDGDYINKYHKDAYQNVYGWLDFNSGNELLKDTRNVTLSGIAPTEIANIEGSEPADLWNIAQLHTHSAEDTGLEHLPIKPKTRMLFYNGLQPTPLSWYLDAANPEQQDTYPLVSPYSEWPINPQNTLNLNWANDIQYWGTVTGYNQNGGTLYTEYWSRYIESLYNKYARRVTAYFTLNNIDLNTFSFDDTIFVNGTYYRPERINNVQIGETTAVQVQLLTANDYRPRVVIDEELFEFTATGIANCAGGSGSINVTTNGTPGFTWLLSNGMSGTALANAAPGNAPYSFTIENVVVGTYNLNVTDSLGRTANVVVTVPVSSGNPVSATHLIADPTDCIPRNCNGEIVVTPSGGAGAPYTIVWNDGGAPNFTRTNLCPDTYEYTVFDSVGCPSPTYAVTLTCDVQPAATYVATQLAADCSGQLSTTHIVESTTPLNINDVVDLQLIDGPSISYCWIITNTSSATATHEVIAIYDSCLQCQGPQPANTYVVTQLIENCSGQLPYTHIVQSSTPLNINDVVSLQLINGPSISYCWIVTSVTSAPATHEATDIYNTCEACYQPQPSGTYVLEDCDTSNFVPVDPNGNSFNFGEVVQYTLYSDPNTILCGAVRELSLDTPVGVIYSANTYSCGDTIHCNVTIP